MGWGTVQWGTVYAVLDEHGGQKERDHAALWAELRAELHAATDHIIGQHRYRDLHPENWAPPDDE